MEKHRAIDLATKNAVIEAVEAILVAFKTTLASHTLQSPGECLRDYVWEFILILFIVWLIQTLFNTNSFKQSPAIRFNETLLYKRNNSTTFEFLVLKITSRL